VGWKSGLSTAPWDARSFYVLICVTLLLATLIGYSSINPVRVLYWSQIVAGFLVVPILLLLLMFGNDKQLMRRRNSGFENFWLGAAVGAMAAANVVLLWTQFR
jgi:Mn2+/Fe2+ NRAMP family transporter